MKKIKKSNSSTFLLIVSTGLLALFLIAVFYNKLTNNSYNQSQVNNVNNTKIYESKDLKFTVNIPSKFQIEEKFTTILLRYNDQIIQINRSGTNFNTLDAHLDNLSKLNSFTFSNRENITIDNYTAVKGLINGEMHYFIYSDNWVYSLSTSSEALFDELDQIARSFKYSPN